MNNTEILIITHIPSFYKTNLYNEISKQKKIFVIFLATNTKNFRSSDFINLENNNYPYLCVTNKYLENFNFVDTIKLLYYIHYKVKFDKIIIGGWELLIFWLITLTINKKKLILNFESTIYESKINLIKNFLKKFFLGKINYIITPGISNLELLKKLDSRNKIILSNGVGLLNINKIPSRLKKNYNGIYLYIGRLSEEKNIVYLVNIFKVRPNLTLKIIGSGPLLSSLKCALTSNIKIMDSIPNYRILNEISNADFLILPSKSEPWGLVVEESLSCNIPVIVSNRCGSSVLIQNGFNGWVFDPNETNSLESILDNINSDLYINLIKSFPSYNLEFNQLIQISSYTNIL